MMMSASLRSWSLGQLHVRPRSVVRPSVPSSEVSRYSIRKRGFRSRGRDDGQLVLAGGVAMAFAILLIAGMTQLGTDMDADQEIEPSLGPEFVHVRSQFEMAASYRYAHSEETAQEAFHNTTGAFANMELRYGLFLTFEIVNVTGSLGNETLQYRMEMVSKEQFLGQDGTLILRR